MGVTLYVGGHGTIIKGEVLTLEGPRCFSAAHRRYGGKGTALAGRMDVSRVHALLDSGAFTDTPAQRLTPEGALARQLAWERAYSERWEQPWQAEALASYDVLIDEKWRDGRRIKQRWTVREAEAAVSATINAAAYLARKRDVLAPRRLVLGVQGVDASQYAACAAAVLNVARPGDWIGLGGFCILGRFQRQWRPTFMDVCRRVVPMVAAAGITRLHIYGVLWPVALGRLLWMADRHGMTLSTDSARPLLDAARVDGRKSGVHGDTWRENVAYWRDLCATLRTSRHYQEPESVARQLSLFAEESS